jgi:transcriptional regulator with XRE-family HTH domain
MRKHIRLPGARKQWAFTQRELADLTGVKRNVISRYEQGNLTPGARTLLALEVIFGRCGRRLFPMMYAEIEDSVMQRAAKLDRQLGAQMDPASVKKRKLLQAMVRRGEPDPL